VCVYLYLLHSKDQKKYFTNRVRTFRESEDILAGPHFFRHLHQKKILVCENILGNKTDSDSDSDSDSNHILRVKT